VCVDIDAREFATSTNIAKAWSRIRKRAGLEDVRIHGLRRTLGSWLAVDGASLPLIGKALNHSQVATTAIYARLQLDPVRIALEGNAQKMLSVSGALLSSARTLEFYSLTEDPLRDTPESEHCFC
jgi:integrase